MKKSQQKAYAKMLISIAANGGKTGEIMRDIYINHKRDDVLEIIRYAMEFEPKLVVTPSKYNSSGYDFTLPEGVTVQPKKKERDLFMTVYFMFILLFLVGVAIAGLVSWLM